MQVFISRNGPHNNQIIKLIENNRHSFQNAIQCESNDVIFYFKFFTIQLKKHCRNICRMAPPDGATRYSAGSACQRCDASTYTQTFFSESFSLLVDVAFVCHLSIIQQFTASVLLYNFPYSNVI